MILPTASIILIFTYLYLLQLGLCQTPPGPLLILQRLEGHQFQVQSQLSQWMTRIQDLFGNGANKQPVRHSVCKRSLSTEDDRFVLAIRKWAGREWHVNIYSQNVQICPNEWTNAAFFKEHGWSWSYLPVLGSEKLDMDAEARTFWPLQFQILQQWPRQAAWLFGVEILFSTPSTHQPSFKQWCATVNLPKQWSFHLSSSRLSSLAQEPTKVTGIIPKELASHQQSLSQIRLTSL